MINTNFNTQSANHNKGGSFNISQNRQDGGGQVILGLQAGQRRFGANMAATPADVKTRLLNLRLAVDEANENAKEAHNNRVGLTPIQEARRSEAERQAENVSSTLDKLRYIESRIPRFHKREFVPTSSLSPDGRPTFNANDSAVASGFLTEGKHTMQLSIGNEHFNLSFTVSSTDTVLDVQQRIADEINSLLNNNVYASVVKDSDTGESRLFVNFRKSAVREAEGPRTGMVGTSATSQHKNLTVTCPMGHEAGIVAMWLGLDHGFDEEHGFLKMLNRLRLNDGINMLDIFLWENGDIVAINWDLFEDYKFLERSYFENQSELSFEQTMQAFLENFNAMQKIDKILDEEGLDNEGSLYEIII